MKIRICSPTYDADRWITMKGTHVHIDGSGNVLKGPPGLSAKMKKDGGAANNNTRSTFQALESHKSSMTHLSPEQRNAVDDYLSGQYQNINSELRLKSAGRIKSMEDETMATVQHLDAAMLSSTLKAPIEVHRGEAVPLREIKNLRPGRLLNNTGYSSTTTDPKIAERFSHEDENSMEKTGPVIYHETIPAGKNALLVGGAESEVLLPRGRWSSVKKVEKVNGIHHVYLS